MNRNERSDVVSTAPGMGSKKEGHPVPTREGEGMMVNYGMVNYQPSTVHDCCTTSRTAICSPDSNLAELLNRGRLQPAQRKVPFRFSRFRGLAIGREGQQERSGI